MHASIRPLRDKVYTVGRGRSVSRDSMMLWCRRYQCGVHLARDCTHICTIKQITSYLSNTYQINSADRQYSLSYFITTNQSISWCAPVVKKLRNICMNYCRYSGMPGVSWLHSTFRH